MGDKINTKKNEVMNSDASKNDFWKQLDNGFSYDSKIIYFTGEVDEFTIERLIMLLTLLDEKTEDVSWNKKPITVKINSFGGSVYDMFGAIDFIQAMKTKVDTEIIGKAMSAAAMLATCTTGKRKMYKNSIIMFHQQSSVVNGNTTELKNDISHCDKLEKMATSLLVKCSKKDDKFWNKVQKKDYYVYSDTAVKLGVIDEIL